MAVYPWWPDLCLNSITLLDAKRPCLQRTNFGGWNLLSDGGKEHHSWLQLGCTFRILFLFRTTKRLSGSTVTTLSSMETRLPSTVTRLESVISRTRLVKISGRLLYSQGTFTTSMVQYTLRDFAQPLINCLILYLINIRHSNLESKFCLSRMRMKANRI